MIYYLFYFWLWEVSVAVCRLSLVAVSGDYTSLWYMSFSLRWLFLLWSIGLVALWHVESSYPCPPPCHFGIYGFRIFIFSSETIEKSSRL